jgi:hypothetical protein
MSPSRLFAFFLCCLPVVSAFADDAQPKITRIRGRVVTVTVPNGFDSISLQRIRSVPRAGGRAQRVWATVDTQFPATQAKTLTFRLSKLMPRRVLRVIGSRSAPLPESFLTSTTTFGADSLSLSNATSSGPSGPSGRSSDVVTLAGNSITSSFTTDTSSSNGTAPTTPVVESDIWKIVGDRLYFFNQLRGLQVLDMSKPDDPALLGTLRMPAAGEDLYVVDENHVALLKRGFDFWGGPIFWGGSILNLRVANANVGAITLAAADSVSLNTTLLPYQQSNRQNELVIADVSAGAPVQVASVPFSGALLESRLVGHTLYIAASRSKSSDDNTYGTAVTAFDLSDPANPVEGDSIFIPGYTNVVTATPDYFVVSGGYPNTLHLVDISGGHVALRETGTLGEAGSVTPEGYVADKFKINIDGDVLTVLSQVWLPWQWNEQGELVLRGGASTVLQTFSLADPAAPAALGRLVIAPGESLRATRFDGDRVYVVTFEQIDPLHIIDLSDPANPTISGTVQAPGFSTYIEPLGDRLVTIGLVNWQPAVSLFDVSDSANPKLLQQLSLVGKNNGWASSEAVWNEKAFKVLASQNLILLPVSGTDLTDTDTWGGEWFARVQLIDLFPDSLAKRGVISANFSPRRADVVNDRIAAISPSKLVVVNANDRDKPKVTAEVALAWSVDRVFHIGEFLVEIGGPTDWTGKPAPTLSVAPASEPDNAITVADLDPLDVVGSTLHDGTLYLAQRAWPRWWISDAAENKPQLLITAYDVSALPKLKKLSQASGPAPLDSWGRLTPLWPSPGTLVWASEGSYIGWNFPIFYATTNLATTFAVDNLATLTTGSTRASVNSLTRSTASTRSIVADNLVFRPYWGGWSKEFISFNVKTPEKIAYGSTIELKPSGYSQFSTPVAQAGLIFVSEQKLFANEKETDPGDVGKHFLRVVEYTEPAAPFVRDERVNIPGRLVGVAREGKLLYTQGCDFDLIDGTARNTAALHASAFDGTAAHLIATQPLANAWTSVAFDGPNAVYLEEQPALIWKPIIYTPNPESVELFTTAKLTLLRPNYWWGGSYENNTALSKLHIVNLTDGGTFTELGLLEVGHDSGLTLFGDLAVTKPDWYSVRTIDLSTANAPADLGAFTFPGNATPNLGGADGSLGTGLWIPTGSYGVETISFEK